jgi:hypothetical protein
MANNEANTDLANAEILWKAADALRGQIDAAEYKHVVLGLLFLKYISDAFEARRDELKLELEAEGIKGPQLESLLENRDEYTAERVFWVPPEARWQNLQNQAARPDIATLIDDAILAVERDNPNLKNKLYLTWHTHAFAVSVIDSSPEEGVAGGNALSAVLAFTPRHKGMHRGSSLLRRGGRRCALQHPTIRKFRILRRQVANEVEKRHIEHYGLEALLAVGCRVRSQRGTQFRQSATVRPPRNGSTPSLA